MFDCDGVLLDSNGMKVSAFRHAARREGFSESTVEAFSAWQSTNFGTSRYSVFSELLAGTFGPVPSRASIDQLLDGYAIEVRAGYMEVPETPGLRNVLVGLRKLLLFVASGSAETELRSVFKERNLSDNFVEIYGSPRPKAAILAGLSKSYPDANFLMVGDAHADADAAFAANMDFAFFAPMSLVADSMSARANREGFPVVFDLNDLIGRPNAR
ncbi:HAD family hydrolase [Cryobacterium sp. Y82]|uniref:HAD family hydrolase n=1 Tax=Cryobacterium sp. Y82 TaxID=2045017 RepID=UPI0013047D3E|nr:HAD hydrolase-like protein [Cryobacterium sp. Y82]